MNCPKCGAKVAADRPCITIFQCGSESDKYPSAFYETPRCLRNQLATVTAERDKLLAAAKAARGELVLLGKDLQEIEDCVRVRPSCLLSDETLAEIDAAIAQAEGTTN